MSTSVIARMRRSSIHRTLLIFSLALVILLSLVFAVVGSSLAYQALMREGRDSLSSVADLKQREIERWVRERERDLDILVAETALQQSLQTILDSPKGGVERLMAHSDLIVRLGAFRRKKVAFAELFLMDPETGEIVFSTAVRREGEAYPEAVYFREGRKGPYLQPPAYDPVLNAPSMLIARPMEGSDKEVLAVLVGRANLADLGLLIQAKAGLGRTGETYLVSAEGLYVAGSQDPSSVLEGALDSVGIRAALSGEAGMGQYINCRGEEVFGAYRWLPKMGVALLVEQSRSEAVAAALRQALAMVGVTVVAAAVASGMALLLTRRIVGPIVELTEAATRISAGDLERVAKVEREDEIGALAQAFNHMTEHLREMLRKEAEQSAEHERLQQEVIEAQKRAIQELSTPIIPVMDRIIVMPLIGGIDSMRARDITRRLLAGIREHQAKVVILDITGVPVVDSGVADYLNKTIQAARLKGAHAIVTGISDAVAETIVDLGIDWSGIETLSDLRTGLRAALAMMGRRIGGKATFD